MPSKRKFSLGGSTASYLVLEIVPVYVKKHPNNGKYLLKNRFQCSKIWFLLFLPFVLSITSSTERAMPLTELFTSVREKKKTTQIRVKQSDSVTKWSKNECNSKQSINMRIAVIVGAPFIYLRVYLFSLLSRFISCPFIICSGISFELHWIES